MAKLLSKETKRALSLKLLPPLFHFLTKLLLLTCKKKFYFPTQRPDTPVIIALWHEYILLSPYIFRNFMGKEKVSVMISEHFDGQIIAKTISYSNMGYIQGSSTRGGIKAVKTSFKLLDEGSCIAITPDGPKGPRHSVADGIVAISQKKNINIVSFRYSSSDFWRLNSWDKFLIPKPFSTISMYASEPFSVTGMTMEEAKQEIKDKLSNVV